MQDVLVIGAGHNGLVAATLLAQAGFKVTVIEEKSMVGGAVKTEYAFPKVPGLATSSGSYLLGPMPPELIQKLGANIQTIRRDPHYFLPRLDNGYLLFGSDKDQMREQFVRFFSQADFEANEGLVTEIGQIRDDLAPCWLKEPLSLAETASRYIRPALQQTFMDLVTQPVENYLARFGFKSELLVAMYAVTDGFSGLDASFGTPGSGHNFLVHNMCRLPGSDGTFMIVKGGMGAITKEFARLAQAAGATIRTNCGVEHILTTQGSVTGVVLNSGEEIRCKTIVCNADPFRMRHLVGSSRFSQDFNTTLDSKKRFGTTLKLNIALSKLPTFSCLKENRGQHNGTIHLLPQGKDVIKQIREGYDEAKKGKLPSFPTIEWYIHTQADPSLQDAQKHHNAAFFVQWAPWELSESSWEKEEDAYAHKLFSVAEQFAPGFSDLVVDYSLLYPQKVQEHFGISYGHIHHIDNVFAFDQRMAYRTPIAGLYSCSAGCHPAGSVIGAAGHNAATCVINDLPA